LGVRHDTDDDLPHDDKPLRKTKYAKLLNAMHLVLIAWGYVVVMMALAEALAPKGTVLGALSTLLLYGALPLWIVLYIMGAPARRRARKASDARQSSGTDSTDSTDATPAASTDPDTGGHAAGDPVAPERKEP
jgi:hypothetical protein